MLKILGISATLILLSIGSSAAPSPLETILTHDPRIIIFSPHPDDDVLSSTGLMTSVLALASHGVKADLRVVYMTCGDGYDQALAITKQKGTAQNFLELGELRHREAVAALGRIGVPPSKAIFLGFPDGGLDVIFSQARNQTLDFLSPHTLSSKVPYGFALHPQEDYVSASVLNDIREIINDFKPTIVFTPTLTDQHGDHRATREFVSEVLSAMQIPPIHLEYLIHWEKIETDWPKGSSTWQTPLNHVPAEYSLSLKEYGVTTDDKKKIIGTHESQVAVEPAYLLNFSKTTEVFWKSKPRLSDYLAKP